LTGHQIVGHKGPSKGQGVFGTKGLLLNHYSNLI